MLKKAKVLLAGSAMVIMGASAASAATITTAYNFAATFTSGPNPLITGRFSLTYDPAVTGNYAVSSFSSNVLGAAYQPVSVTNFGTFIALGSDCLPNGCSVAAGQNDFFARVPINQSGDVTAGAGSLSYSATGMTIYTSTNFTASREVVAAAVPEPATWAMMMLGLGAVGYSLRRRPKVSVAVKLA